LADHILASSVGLKVTNYMEKRLVSLIKLVGGWGRSYIQS